MSTEKAIKNAAMQVFLKDGLEGARMQEIANLAGVNKAMLHYYFSSKEVLFDTVFSDVLLDLIPEIESLLSSDQSIIEKIKAFIQIQIGAHQCNPCFLGFVITETSKNPDRMVAHIKKMEPFKTYITTFMQQYLEEAEQGKVRYYSPLHLFMMINGMIDHYFISKPFFQGIFGEGDIQFDEEFDKQLPEEINRFIENALIIK